MVNFFEGSLTRFSRCYVLTCLYLYINSFQFLCVCCYCCCYYFLSIYLYLKGLFGLEAANSGFGWKVWVKGLVLVATFARKPEIRHVADFIWQQLPYLRNNRRNVPIRLFGHLFSISGSEARHCIHASTKVGYDYSKWINKHSNFK